MEEKNPNKLALACTLMAPGRPGRHFFEKTPFPQSLSWAILSLGLSPCAGTYPLLLGVSLSAAGEVHGWGTSTWMASLFPPLHSVSWSRGWTLKCLLGLGAQWTAVRWALGSTRRHGWGLKVNEHEGPTWKCSNSSFEPWDFLGGPAVKNLPSNTGDVNSGN